MAEKKIKLSKKHGVNPSIEICFLCGKEKGIILFGKMKKDAEAPKQACYNKQPCESCKKMMEQGIMFISVRDGSDKDNPYRTGKLAVVAEESVRDLFKGKDELNSILNNRAVFVEDSMFDVWFKDIEFKKEGESDET